MNHTEWVQRFKAATGLSEPAARSAALVALADESKALCENLLSDWHEHQALGGAGMFLEQAGEFGQARPIYERSLELCRAKAAYWNRAVVDGLATVATMHFREGAEDEGMSVGEEALKWLARAPQADSGIRELVNLMAECTQKGGRVPQAPGNLGR
jgi:hypothetical protein